MQQPRIAVFDKWLPFDLAGNLNQPSIDDPINWEEFTAEPRFELMYEGTQERYFYLDDPRAINEVHRIIKFQTCPICRSTMRHKSIHVAHALFVCTTCGFWGGNGNRWEHAVYQVPPRRGVLGLYKNIKPLSEGTTGFLVTHLRKFPKDLPKITAKRSEKFVIELLKDFLKCDVKALGGTKDKGIDGFILKGDEIETIIQVKWRQDMGKTEGVKVVREVAGTLLARGVPKGILVSNSGHFSQDAVDEAVLIGLHKIERLGNMKLDLMDYHNVLDMLEISNTEITKDMSVDDWFLFDEDFPLFDGARKLEDSFVAMFRK